MAAPQGRIEGRCETCGRPVFATQHTRGDYQVDYYSLYSGHGEVTALAGDERTRGQTYVRLIDRFDVITCADCYQRPEVQAERERRFRPEREASAETDEA
jgi:hypothetical protein